MEIRTPGFGVPGALGILSISLFFWGHWLVQLAGLEELLLVGAGLLLLTLEVFVIPGFGITGILGIASLLAGLSLSVVGGGASWEFILGAVGQVIFSLLLAVIGSLLLFRFLPHLPWGRRLILETGLDAGAGLDAAPEQDRQWLGKLGTVISPLRPAGIAEIGGERIDVVSDGEFIEQGEQVAINRVDGNRMVVRRIRRQTEGSQDDRK
jgi:membrane-bound serine protease (ClpP class)